MAKPAHPKKILLILSCLGLILYACGSPSAATQPISAAASPTVATIPTVTSPPQETATTQAIPSTTPAQESILILPTTLEQPGAWILRNPYAYPSASKLFTASPDGYALSPDFEVASIELSYRWIGIGNEVYDYQRIERRDNGFWKNDEQLSSVAVGKLVQAIAHLRPEPQSISVTVWTDDYPTWAVELTSLKGDKVLLYSDSNAPSYIPWNVFFNGEIYAQFDGAIPSALDGLFTVIEGRTIASTGGCQCGDYLPATTIEGPPYQIRYGFSGLLPVYKEFGYWIEAEKGELQGYLSGITWTDKVGKAEINWLTGLQAVEVQPGMGQKVACSLENVPTDYPDSVYQRFTCPIGQPGEGPTYDYPIQMTFATSSGQPYILSGELFGYWESSMTLPVTAYPEEIGEILKSAPSSGDLLRDHLMYVVDFLGSAAQTTGEMSSKWEADVALLGQVELGERIIPYTVMINNVKIENGKLVRWELDRAELENLLKDVLSQTVTQRFVEYEPMGVINLYYAEDGDYSLIEPDYLPACADLPAVIELPTADQPYRGFSFNMLPSIYRYGFYSSQFLLLKDGVRVYDVDLDPSATEAAFWMSILPDTLKPQNAPPFTRIINSTRSSEIFVGWSTDASATEVSEYNAMFAGWDVEISGHDPGLNLLHKQFGLTPDGRVTLVDCQAP